MEMSSHEDINAFLKRQRLLNICFNACGPEEEDKVGRE